MRGVTRLPSGKFAAEINEPRSTNRRWLGTFSDLLVAACAYDLAARILQGHKAKTNFPYPPPYDLVEKVIAAPGRRALVYIGPPLPAPAPAATPQAAPGLPGPVDRAPPPQAPAPAPAAIPPAAPAPVPFEDVPYKAPPRVVTGPGITITFVRSTPVKPFPVQAAAAASRRVSDPVDHFAPPIRNVAPATKPVPASSAETCFSSTTDPQLRASASSSCRTPTVDT
jgi:hypothetical protein